MKNKKPNPDEIYHIHEMAMAINELGLKLCQERDDINIFFTALLHCVCNIANKSGTSRHKMIEIIDITYKEYVNEDTTES